MGNKVSGYVKGGREMVQEEDGSRKERGPGKEDVPSYYCAPLLTDTCPLLSLPPTSLELILYFLPLRDVSHFARSCSHLDSVVGEFLRHQCETQHLSQALRDFLKGKFGLLTQTEKEVGERLEMQEDSRQRLYRLLHHRNIYQTVGDRVTCCDPRVDIPHRDNRRYMDVKQMGKLGRKVVEVVTVCWLSVTHTWDQVQPGNYQVSLRLMINDNFTWPHTEAQMSRWSVKFPSLTGEEETQLRVGRQWWRMLQQLRSPSASVSGQARGNQCNSVGRGLVADWEMDHCGHTTGWIHVILPVFTVEKQGSVTFQFQDIECPWWKGGVAFDFIELRRIE